MQLRIAAARPPGIDADAAWGLAELEFRRIMVASSGNRALATLAERVSAGLLSADSTSHRTDAVAEHEAVVAAVRAHDGAAARIAMQAHLDAVAAALEIPDLDVSKRDLHHVSQRVLERHG
jgi:DNA-binding FadR family transcriptional regulator